ncbi:MAG: DNA-binding protein [Candidatus Aenigmatarchaeota archaeon]
MEEFQKNEILRKILEPKAKERLARVKLVKPQLVEQIEDYLIKMFNSGKINNRISEKEIIKLLESLNR